MAKRVLATLAALCLLAVMGSVGTSAAYTVALDASNEPVFTLTTNDYLNGEFNILVIPDAHQTGSADDNLINFIEAAVKYGKQEALDLVLFLGDATSGTGTGTEAALKASVAKLLAPIIEAKVPYTVVLGDEDCGALGRKATLDIWRAAGEGVLDPIQYKFEEIDDSVDPQTVPPTMKVTAEGEMTPSLFMEPTVESDDGLNFKYLIHRNLYTDNVWKTDTFETYDKNGERNVLKAIIPYVQLFLFDIGSNAEGKGGLPYVRAAGQLDWFTEHNNAELPAYVFQHIPAPEVYTGGFFLKSPCNWKLPCTRNIMGTNYYGTPNFIKMVGTVLEAPQTPNYSEGWYETVTANGNVQAAFFGHNHLNNFIEKRDKIDLVQLPGAAWNGGRGTYLVRGAAFVNIRGSGIGSGVGGGSGSGAGPASYGCEYFTYRQAQRVSGSKVSGRTNTGIKDWIQVVPFLLQNIIINCFAPVRWIMGGF